MSDAYRSSQVLKPEPVRTVLVVDDEAANRQLLSAILTANGHQVLVANDGPAALAMAGSHAIDAILLDVMMPLMDGIEVCRRLRQELRLENTIIVFVTALSDRDSRLRAREVGADDFLVKPIDGFELVFRVNQWMNLRRYRELEHRLSSLTCVLDDACDSIQDVASRVASAASTLNASQPALALEASRHALEQAAVRLARLAKDTRHLAGSSAAWDASGSAIAKKGAPARREHRS